MLEKGFVAVAKGKSLPWFRFWPADFSGDGVVEAMTTTQVGAYQLLLCKAWFEKPVGTIPDDDNMLSKWARTTLKEWISIKAGVLKAFTKGADNRWHQKRMKLEYAWAKNVQKGKSIGGTNGAKARWHSHKKAIYKPMTENGYPQSHPQSHSHPPPNPLFAALRWAGVGGAAQECANTPGLTPVGVIILREQAKAEKKKDVGGWIVSQLRSGWNPNARITPKLLCKMAKSGIVKSICGNGINGCVVGYNDTAIHLNHGKELSVEIAAEQLTNESIEFIFPEAA